MACRLLYLGVQYKDSLCIADSCDQVPQQEEGENRDPHLGVGGPGEPKPQLKAGTVCPRSSYPFSVVAYYIN